MNKLFKGLAAFAAASTLCVCPINATEDNKNSKNVTVQSDENKPSQFSTVWNAGWIGKCSLLLSAGCILETGYIVADKVFGVFNN